MATTGYQAALDTNDLIMGYGKESAWGTKPTIGFQDIRLDGEGFSSSKSRTRPAEINAAGQASASITTKIESTGSLNFSASAGTFNDLLASSVGGEWSAPTHAGSDISTTATAINSVSDFTSGFVAGQAIKVTCNGASAALLHNNTYVITAVAAKSLTVTLIAGIAAQTIIAGNVGYCKIERIALYHNIENKIAAVSDGFTDADSNFVTKGVQVGQMLKISGFFEAANNGYFRVNTVVAGKITTTPAPTAEAAAVAKYCTIKGNMVRNGLDFQSFYFQKKLGTGLYLDYAGAFPTGGGLDVAVGDYLKGTLSFLNKGEAKNTVDASTGNHLAAPTGIVIDSINGIGTVKWKGSAIAAAVQKIGIKWNKEGAASQFAIGDKTAKGVRKGTMTVSGSLGTYFADFTLYDDFISESAGPLGFPATDIDGKGYYITICQGTIMNPKVVAGGPGQDVMAEFEIEGNPDTSGYYGGKTIQIDYFG